MRVLLISDFGVHHTPGGAQRSNQIIVDIGRQRGHEISVMHYDTVQNYNIPDYDIVISSNLEVLSRTTNVVEVLSMLKNHYRLEHDMNMYLSTDERKKLWGNCRKSFFLTKFHYRKFIEAYGDIFINVEIVPDPIGSDFRVLPEIKRLNQTLYVGFMHQLKGTDAFIEYAELNPNKTFLAACWGPRQYEEKISSLPNVQRIFVPHNRMPEVYNSCNQMFYCPIVNEPFCRAVGEAIMCGIKSFIINDRVGSFHMYKEEPNSFSEKCMNAADLFWEIIESDYDDIKWV